VSVSESCGCPKVQVEIAPGQFIEVEDCTGVSCEDRCEENNISCGLEPILLSHISYSKVLSYETLQEGFTVDIARINNASEANNLEADVFVEILVK
jgi:hypothetical protein